VALGALIGWPPGPWISRRLPAGSRSGWGGGGGGVGPRVNGASERRGRSAARGATKCPLRLRGHAGASCRPTLRVRERVGSHIEGCTVEEPPHAHTRARDHRSHARTHRLPARSSARVSQTPRPTHAGRPLRTSTTRQDNWEHGRHRNAGGVRPARPHPQGPSRPFHYESWSGRAARACSVRLWIPKRGTS
jgi:hypothetical protein